MSLREGEWAGWLVESRGPDGIDYLENLEDGTATWTEDVHEALAFAREVDALKIAAFMHDVHVEEHLFVLEDE